MIFDQNQIIFALLGALGALATAGVCFVLAFILGRVKEAMNSSLFTPEQCEAIDSMTLGRWRSRFPNQEYEIYRRDQRRIFRDKDEAGGILMDLHRTARRRSTELEQLRESSRKLLSIGHPTCYHGGTRSQTKPAMHPGTLFDANLPHPTDFPEHYWFGRRLAGNDILAGHTHIAPPDHNERPVFFMGSEDLKEAEIMFKNGEWRYQ